MQRVLHAFRQDGVVKTVHGERAHPCVLRFLRNDEDEWKPGGAPRTCLDNNGADVKTNAGNL